MDNQAFWFCSRPGKERQNMNVTLLAHTPNPEKLVASAAKLCYANTPPGELFDGLTEEKAAGFVEMLASMGHESPIEHVSFTFAIEGVSRSLLAEITRHRIASFSVQSQRYVKKSEICVVTPPEIEALPEAKKLFEQTMEAEWNAYNQLADLLEKKHFERFLQEGKTEKEARFQAQKKAIEDARFVLPNACETKMIVTMNARSLHNFFRLRCCQRAQWEIRALATQMLRLVCEVAPTLFASAGPSCYRKGCPEGAKSCGQAAQMREQFAALHAQAEEVYRKKREARQDAR